VCAGAHVVVNPLNESTYRHPKGSGMSFSAIPPPQHVYREHYLLRGAESPPGRVSTLRIKPPHVPSDHKISTTCRHMNLLYPGSPGRCERLYLYYMVPFFLLRTYVTIFSTTIDFGIRHPCLRALLSTVHSSFSSLSSP
jgi:hypothetical protein